VSDWQSNRFLLLNQGLERPARNPARRPTISGPYPTSAGDEFFSVFDDSDVAFLHGEGESRFNKFVAKETASG
jgi:hypothetical protein